MLLLIIDLSPEADPKPEEAYRQLLKELSLYSEKLTGYPRVVAGNKMDLPGAAENFERLRRVVEDNVALFPISAATGSGVSQLTRHLAARVAHLSAREAAQPDIPVIKAAPGCQPAGPLFTVEKKEIFCGPQ